MLCNKTKVQLQYMADFFGSNKDAGMYTTVADDGVYLVFDNGEKVFDVFLGYNGQEISENLRQFLKKNE